MNKTVNGIHVNDSDNGRTPLLFVHAFPLNSEMWNPQVKHFGNEYRVITYDARGLGKSVSDNNLFFMEDYADDLLFIISKLGLKNVNAVGLSMGGYIIQRALVKSPSLFKTVTLADTKGERDTDEGLLSRSEVIRTIMNGKREEFVTGFIKKLISPANYKNPELVRTLEAIISLNSDKGICGAVNALATRTTTLHQLEQLDIPALIIVGEEDVLTPLKCSEDLAKSFKNSELHLIKKSGHMSSLENPSEFNSILGNFLKRYN